MPASFLLAACHDWGCFAFIPTHSEAIAGLIGSFIAVFIAIWTLNRNHQNERQRAEEALEESTTHFLEGVKTELLALNGIYKNVVEKALKQSIQDSYLQYEFCIRQNYFCFFEQNNNKLGQVNDSSLRQDIITTYVALKALVDKLNIYSDALRRYHEYCLASQATQGTMQNAYARLRDRQRNLLESETKIISEELNPDIQKKFEITLNAINSYLE
tara:strand:+ start:39 stop:683 length:645 start_codon:yes stop_codon:yes gene_type:complete